MEIASKLYIFKPRKCWKLWKENVNISEEKQSTFQVWDHFPEEGGRKNSLLSVEKMKEQAIQRSEYLWWPEWLTLAGDKASLIVVNSNSKGHAKICASPWSTLLSLPTTRYIIQLSSYNHIYFKCKFKNIWNDRKFYIAKDAIIPLTLEFNCQPIRHMNISKSCNSSNQIRWSTSVRQLSHFPELYYYQR